MVLCAGRLQDAVEGEGRAHRRRTEAGDGAVEPAGGGDVSGRPPDEEHHGHVGQRVEAQVEGIGHRRRGGRGPAEGLDGEGDVPEAPGEQAASEDEGRGPTRSVGDPLCHTQAAGDQLDTADDPTIEPGPRLAVGAEDEGEEVTRQQETEHRVDAPDHADRTFDPPDGPVGAPDATGGRRGGHRVKLSSRPAQFLSRRGPDRPSGAPARRQRAVPRRHCPSPGVPYATMVTCSGGTAEEGEPIGTTAGHRRRSRHVETARMGRSRRSGRDRSGRCHQGRPPPSVPRFRGVPRRSRGRDPAVVGGPGRSGRGVDLARRGPRVPR